MVMPKSISGITSARQSSWLVTIISATVTTTSVSRRCQSAQLVDDPRLAVVNVKSAQHVQRDVHAEHGQRAGQFVRERAAGEFGRMFQVGSAPSRRRRAALRRLAVARPRAWASTLPGGNTVVCGLHRGGRLLLLRRVASTFRCERHRQLRLQPGEHPLGHFQRRHLLFQATSAAASAAFSCSTSLTATVRLKAAAADRTHRDPSRNSRRGPAAARRACRSARAA